MKLNEPLIEGQNHKNYTNSQAKENKKWSLSKNQTELSRLHEE